MSSVAWSLAFAALYLQLSAIGRATTHASIQRLRRFTGAAVAVSLTAAELRSLLGHTANLTVSGSVSSPSGSVTVTPTQVLRVTSTFEIILSTTEG